MKTVKPNELESRQAYPDHYDCPFCKPPEEETGERSYERQGEKDYCDTKAYPQRRKELSQDFISQGDCYACSGCYQRE